MERTGEQTFRQALGERLEAAHEEVSPGIGGLQRAPEPRLRVFARFEVTARELPQPAQNTN